MDEATLNRWIKNSFTWAYKIPDPPRMVVQASNQRPFDGFAVDQNQGVIFWEAKLVKGDERFAFNLIKPHQIDNLLRIKEAIQKDMLLLSKIFCIIYVGFYIPRKGVRLFSFDINMIHSLMLEGKKSFLKKEIQTLYEYSVLSEKERFNIDLESQLISTWSLNEQEKNQTS